MGPNLRFKKSGHVWVPAPLYENPAKTRVSITYVRRSGVTPQPYAIAGGVGSSYGVKKALEAPETFPPAFLKETVHNIMKYSEKYGAHLEKYVKIVGEFLRTDRKHWEQYQARIAAEEADLLKQD